MGMTTDDPHPVTDAAHKWYWAAPGRAQANHIFDSGQSLCGKYRGIQDCAHRQRFDPESDEYEPGVDCKTCAIEAGLVA